MNIKGRLISNEKPPYIIAELSANHGGDLNTALQSIKSAKQCGADAIKIQTYTADSMTFNKNSIKINNGIWSGNSLYDLYKKAETPYDWHKSLFNFADKENITIFSSPFDEQAVDLLESINCPAYKIASFEIVDIPLIKYVSKKNKPIIISTGMASLEEISEAVEAAKISSNSQIALLHCVSSYPAKSEDFNLNTIKFLKREFNLPIGLSDHSIGINVPLSSIAIGACIIEKHFILDRKIQTPDSSFSIIPEEFKELCDFSKSVWKSLGSENIKRKKIEDDNKIYRRSLFFNCDLQKGEIITNNVIVKKRPNLGVSPKLIDNIIGKKVNKNIKKYDPITLDLLDN